MNILDSAGESLVLLRVVVLESNLKINRLHELPLLLLARSQHSLDTLVQLFTRHLTHDDF